MFKTYRLIKFVNNGWRGFVLIDPEDDVETQNTTLEDLLASGDEIEGEEEIQLNEDGLPNWIHIGMRYIER